MAFQQAEKIQLGNQIMQELSQTSFACTSLTPINGGTANFLFRGVLAQPLPNAANTIVVKHSKAFVAANRKFELDISRCNFEVIMLNVLDTFSSITVDNLSVRTPHLYQFDRKTNTQILEDLSDTIDIKTVLVSLTDLSVLPRSISTSIGYALGAWLRSFHSWTSAPAQATLQGLMADNKPMRKIRYTISYGTFIDVVQKFPSIWETHSKALQEVKNMAIVEYSKAPQENADENWGIIHGDFWSGNVLMPNTLSLAKNQQQQQQQSEKTNLFIIDWELAQFGRKEYDLGQMIGDLYERKHFTTNANNSALWIIQGFITGYNYDDGNGDNDAPQLSEDSAFRIAIHAGVHLICWSIRRDPPAASTTTEPSKQVQDAVRIGTDFVVKGWERDRRWFVEKSELACLFG